MARKPQANNARVDILDAAAKLVARKGSSHLTIDAVAAEAGLSKGGVLYHFPSKEALLVGMLEQMVDTISPIVDDYRTKHADKPNPTLRAVIEGSRFPDGINSDVATAILAAAAQNPALLDPVRNLFKKRWEQIAAECTDKDEATLLWCAAEGMMFCSLLNLMPFPLDKRDHLIARLSDMAANTSSNCKG